MASTEPVDVTKKQIESANEVWEGFMRYGRWTVYFCIACLVILGLVFIDW